MTTTINNIITKIESNRVFFTFNFVTRNLNTNNHKIQYIEDNVINPLNLLMIDLTTKICKGYTDAIALSSTAYSFRLRIINSYTEDVLERSTLFDILLNGMYKPPYNIIYTPTIRSISLNFSFGSINEITITNVEYRIDSGDWIVWDNVIIDNQNRRGNGIISNLNYRLTPYKIELREKSVLGVSPSAEFNAVPYDKPSPPYNLSYTSQFKSVLINFYLGDTNSVGVISKIQYNLNNSELWYDLENTSINNNGISSGTITMIYGFYIVRLRTISTLGENIFRESEPSDEIVVAPYDNPFPPYDIEYKPKVNSAYFSYLFGQTNGSGNVVKIQYTLDDNPTLYDLSNQFIDDELIGGSGTIPYLDYRITPYVVYLYQITELGKSNASDAITITTYGRPSPPYDIIVNPQLNGASISFKLGDRNGSGNSTIYYTRGTTYNILSGVIDNDTNTGSGIIPLPYRASPPYSIVLRQTSLLYPDAYSVDSEPFTVIPYGINRPSAPIITNFIPLTNSVFIQFTLGSTNGSGNVIKIQNNISRNGWTDLKCIINNVDMTGNATISLLYSSNPHTIRLREYSQYGKPQFSLSSNTITVTPYSTNPSLPPTNIQITPGINSAYVSFNLGDTNGSGNVTNVLYFINNVWNPLSNIVINNVNGTGYGYIYNLNHYNNPHTITFCQYSEYGIRFASINIKNGASINYNINTFSDIPPNTPYNIDITSLINSCYITFSLGNTNGSGEVTKIEYSIDNGVNWNVFNCTIDQYALTGKGTLNLLYNEIAAYTLILREYSRYGSLPSNASRTSSVRPYNTTPMPPYNISILRDVVILNKIMIDFNIGTLNGAGNIVRFEYSLNGVVWIRLIIGFRYDYTKNIWVENPSLASFISDARLRTHIFFEDNSNDAIIYIRQVTQMNTFSVANTIIGKYPYRSSSPSNIVTYYPKPNTIYFEFTVGESNNSGNIVSFQYSINSLYQNFMANYIDIKNKRVRTNEITVNYGISSPIRIRQVSEYNIYSLDDFIYVTPYGYPSHPSSINTFYPTPNNAYFEFTIADTNGSGNIINIEYTMNGTQWYNIVITHILNRQHGEDVWVNVDSNYGWPIGTTVRTNKITVQYNYGNPYFVSIRVITDKNIYSESTTVEVRPFGYPSPPYNIIPYYPYPNTVYFEFTSGNLNNSGAIVQYEYTLMNESWNIFNIEVYMNANDFVKTYPIDLPYKNGNSYDIVLRQVSYNSALSTSGVYSSTVNISVTPYDFPSSPYNITVSPRLHSAYIEFVFGNANLSGNILRFEYTIGEHYDSFDNTFDNYNGNITLDLPYNDGFGYSFAIRQVNENATSMYSSPIMIYPYTNTLSPSKPTNIKASPLDHRAFVSFSFGSTNDSGKVTNMYYSIDDGNTWVEFMFRTNNTTGNGIIQPLPYGSTYFIMLKQRTEYGGESEQSDVVTVKPYGNIPPLPPKSVSAKPEHNSVSFQVNFGNTNWSGNITRVEYSINNGKSWLLADVTYNLTRQSAIGTIWNLRGGTTYTILFRQGTEYGGASYNSAPIIVRPNINPTVSAKKILLSNRDSSTALLNRVRYFRR